MSCLLAFVALVFLGDSISWQALWFPLILLPMLFLALGLGWLLAALGVYFRDSQQLTGFLGQALFYASAVFYPSSRIPEPIYAWLKYNPVLQAIELSRDVLLWNIGIDYEKLLFLYIVGLVSMLLGFVSFQGLRDGFADVL
jgi:lipopolysaccharide transport system permease protein